MPQFSARSTVRLSALLLLAAAPALAQNAKDDPRVGLKPGYTDAGQAAKGLALVANVPRPAGFFDPSGVTSPYGNSDLAFRAPYVFQGNYNGFQIWDVSNPGAPKLRNAVVCPGNQGDPSVYGNLLFISIQATSARLDCGAQGVTDTVSAERFRGVRIYDISDLDHPKILAAVQTCRGSHTHTLVPDPNDKRTLYVYVSGTSVVRSGKELDGCSSLRPEEDPNTSLFRIDVIKVPLDAPQDAKVIAHPRLFEANGQIAGLAKGGDNGPGTQTTSETNQCHDITVFPEYHIAAGACSGNGILIDISDPANPKRITEVSDPNFAYWHSATFNNDATRLVFTDEWGGGSAPRCRATDRPEWGADAIFALADRKLTFGSFFKLPAAQTELENCVAHNGSIIPVPGRDIFVQSWYQGGISLIDFTNPAKPFEIGYFDRGPLMADKIMQAGHWSAYWYNGHVYGSEIARGLDILKLVPTDALTQNEIDAANSVEQAEFNPQMQPHLTWKPSFAVAKAYLDQLKRDQGMRPDRLARVADQLRAAENGSGPRRDGALGKLANYLEGEAPRAADPAKVRALADTVRGLLGKS